MKSFDEFWSSISEEDFARMAEKALPDSVLKVSSGTIDVTPLVIMSASLTHQILQEYHAWLCEQL